MNYVNGLFVLVITVPVLKRIACTVLKVLHMYFNILKLACIIIEEINFDRKLLQQKGFVNPRSTFWFILYIFYRPVLHPPGTIWCPRGSLHSLVTCPSYSFQVLPILQEYNFSLSSETLKENKKKNYQSIKHTVMQRCSMSYNLNLNLHSLSIHKINCCYFQP